MNRYHWSLSFSEPSIGSGLGAFDESMFISPSSENIRSFKLRGLLACALQISQRIITTNFHTSMCSTSCFTTFTGLIYSTSCSDELIFSLSDASR